MSDVLGAMSAAVEESRRQLAAAVEARADERRRQAGLTRWASPEGDRLRAEESGLREALAIIRGEG